MVETLMSIGTADQDENLTMTRREIRLLVAAGWGEGRTTGRNELADSAPSAFVTRRDPWIACNPYREIEQE